jgi:DNA primase large subunit
MRQLHEALKREHHLKHGGRLQFGLFLKGAGMRLEDALLFWQTEFTKNMTIEDFTKKYAYNIRHNYGQEGKRVDYTPKSCNKIIMGNPPGVGDHHGCPFKHYDDEHLSALLSQLRIGSMEKQQILSKAKASHYGVACQMHFEAIHPGYTTMPDVRAEGVGNHPNGWFLASVQYHKAKNGSMPTDESKGGDKDAQDTQQTTAPTVEDSVEVAP